MNHIEYINSEEGHITGITIGTLGNNNNYEGELMKNKEWKILQVTDDDILNGKPNSMTCCAIALALDRQECMQGKYEPGRSHLSPEVHCSDEIYINNSKDKKDYLALFIKYEDRDEVDHFIKEYDEWGPHGGGDILSDITNLRFRYRIEHGDPMKWDIDERLGI